MSRHGVGTIITPVPLRPSLSVVHTSPGCRNSGTRLMPILAQNRSKRHSDSPSFHRTKNTDGKRYDRRRKLTYAKATRQVLRYVQRPAGPTNCAAHLEKQSASAEAKSRGPQQRGKGFSRRPH